MRFNDERIPFYLPSIQPIYVKTWQKTLSDSREGVKYGSPLYTPKQFNFFSDFKHAVFNYPYALYSAGHAELDMGKAVESEWAIHKRDRAKTFLLLDSGGYQIKTGVWDVSTSAKAAKLRQQVLEWQEATGDCATILDMPMGDDGDFDACLAFTKESLKFYEDKGSGKIPFLNVIQGRTFEQARDWYEQTKSFEAGGLAFANYNAQNLYTAVKLLFHLIRTGEMSRYRYIHFLGNGTIYTAVLFYVLKRLIGRIVGHNVTFTQDAASESILAGKFNRIFLQVNEDRPLAKTALTNIFTGDYEHVSPFTIRIVPFESTDLSYVRHNEFYPFATSPLLGPPDGIRYGDLINPSAGKGRDNVDEITRVILYANNVWLKIHAIERATAIERQARRLHYTWLKGQNDTHFQKLYFDIVGKDLEKTDPDDPVVSVVDISAALYELFRDNFDPDGTFEDDVKRLEPFKPAFEKVFAKWFKREMEYGV